MNLKIYVYPAAKRHLHDSAGKFKNTVPLSDYALRKSVELSGPKQCQFFYMGQFDRQSQDHLVSTRHWPHFDRYPERHILDIEGDWKFQESPNKEIPRIIDQSIITINAADRERFAGVKVFVRPNISMLMLHLLKQDIAFSFPKEKRFFFRGKPDYTGARERCRLGMNIAGISGSFEWTKRFQGHDPVHSSSVRSFEKEIRNNAISICPRGSGPDSVRFYEVCALGRVPILVGNNILPGEDNHDMSWLLKIDYRSSEQELAEFFIKVNSMSMIELRDRGLAAKNYFDTVIRSYFRNPTKSFISWLQRRDLISK